MGESSWRPRVESIIATWRSGAPVDAARAVQADSALAGEASAVVELAYEEYRWRRQAGELLDSTSFCARFPSCASQLREMIRVHQVLLDEHPSWFAELQAAALEPDWPVVGSSWEGLELLRELGRGAHSRVYLAREPDPNHPTSTRIVAAKVTPHESREAQLQGMLCHPNIMPVIRSWRSADQKLSITLMPFVGESTLRESIDGAHRDKGRDAPSAVLNNDILTGEMATVSRHQIAQESHPILTSEFIAEVIRIGIELSSAIAYAHERGVYHCDIKPSNIIIGNCGTVLLADFNLATTRSNCHEVLGGTLAYMPPERLIALGISDRAFVEVSGASPGGSDLYSLCVVLFELATGKLPYAVSHESGAVGNQVVELLRRQIAGPPSIDCPPDTTEGRFVELLLQCLDCRVDRRLQDPKEFSQRAIRILRESGAFHGDVSKPSSEKHKAHFNYSRVLKWVGSVSLVICCLVASVRPLPLTRRGLAGVFVQVNTRLGNARVRCLGGGDTAWAIVGDYHLLRGEYQAALAFYERARRGESECNAVLLNNIGLANLLMSRLDDASYALDRSIQCDPEIAEAYENRIQLAHLRLAESASADEDIVRSDVAKWRRQIKEDCARLHALGSPPPLLNFDRPVKLAWSSGERGEE